MVHPNWTALSGEFKVCPSIKFRNIVDIYSLWLDLGEGKLSSKKKLILNFAMNVYTVGENIIATIEMQNNLFTL